ncbi:hypothetical protein [Sphingomonas sp.]|jgi:hypothetical protein|uniref:hypothetical protein n=1 Tax=Sphingomonas sp. TaxID=28214 RepID=UPI002D808B99|nr:hypothetical protein [Sphingomonas sp.]HEU0043650.1 hypothetical protein [Sphingomonas sp.]
MSSTRRCLLAGAAVLGLSAGAWAGFDATGQVDRFYTAAPAPVYMPIPPEPRATGAWEWGSQSLAAAPVAGTIWGREVGRDERAFFDTEDALPEEVPARVHRASVQQADPVAAKALPVPALDAEEPVDGYVEAPASNAKEPLAEPPLG